MTVGELVEVLERMREDVEVRLAMQPAWPMQHTIHDVLLVEAGEYEHEDAYAEEVEEDVVYLVDGGQMYEAPYLPGVASSKIGWVRS